MGLRLPVTCLVLVGVACAWSQQATEYRVSVRHHPEPMDVAERTKRDLALSEYPDKDRANVEDRLQVLKKGFVYEGTAAFFAGDGLVWMSVPAPLLTAKTAVLQTRMWTDRKASYEVPPAGINVMIRSLDDHPVMLSLGDRLFLCGALPKEAKRVSTAKRKEVWRRDNADGGEELIVERKNGVPIGGRLLRNATRVPVLAAVYKVSGGKIVVERYRGPNRLDQTLTYTPTGRKVNADTTIPAGATVSDFRIGGEQAVYVWAERLPSVDELRAMRPGSAFLARGVVLPTLALAVGTVALIGARRSRKGPRRQGPK